MIKVEGILKKSQEILLDSAAIENITDKVKKRTNHQIYRKMQVLRATSTKISHMSETLKSDIQVLEAKQSEGNKLIQKYLDLIKKRM